MFSLAHTKGLVYADQSLVDATITKALQQREIQKRLPQIQGQIAVSCHFLSNCWHCCTAPIFAHSIEMLLVVAEVQAKKE